MSMARESCIRSFRQEILIDEEFKHTTMKLVGALGHQEVRRSNMSSPMSASPPASIC